MKNLVLKIAFASSVLVTAFENCSNSTSFDATPASSQSCTSTLSALTVPVKLLFVVDMSGSNADGTTYYGTDPNKAVRGGSIQKFFTDYGSLSNFSWGFITFNGSSAQSLIGNSTNPTFTASSAQMQAAINNFYAMADTNLTPYEAALQMARLAIANDSAASSKTKYIVVFLSDGEPDPAVTLTTLQSEVASIVGLRTGQITFNTIFYGSEDTTASALLSGMASAGGGKFLDTNASPSGTDFQISQQINVPGTSCTQ